MSSSSESDFESSSSDDESFSVSKGILNDSSSSARINQNMIQSVSTHVSIIVSTMLMDTRRPRSGSVVGRRYVHRDRNQRHELIVNDYFKGENSKYTAEQFRRRFRMDVKLFNRILNAIGNHDDYFRPKVDAVGKCGISPLQKMVAALRMLAYGCAADFLDEYVQIGETTTIDTLKHFCDAVTGVFEERYLRRPDNKDVERLLKEGEERRFPGMLGSLDCMHWHWKNCPTTWHGTHTNGFKRVHTLILEVVASKDLWIWHAFFDMEGTNNDINVLDRSPLFNDLINGVAPPCNFEVNGHHYHMGYYLSDGIYPSYVTITQNISEPSSKKEKLFARRQEAVRKNVERAFGVLQSRWHIVKSPGRMWDAKDLGKIMKTCIILHNMIIESERHQGLDPENWVPHVDEIDNDIHLEHDYSFLVSRMIGRLKEVRSTGVYGDLKVDLINHLWDIYGDAEA